MVIVISFKALLSLIEALLSSFLYTIVQPPDLDDQGDWYIDWHAAA